MSPPTPRRYPIRIYWEDTDAGGVVYHANYLRFFERARSDWLRDLGLQQQRLRLEFGCVLVVSDLQIRYHAPARLDDLIQVSVQMQRHGKATLALEQQAWRDQSLLAQAQVRVGCVDAETLRPLRMPEPLLALLAAGAAG